MGLNNNRYVSYVFAVISELDDGAHQYIRSVYKSFFDLLFQCLRPVNATSREKLLRRLYRLAYDISC